MSDDAHTPAPHDLLQVIGREFVDKAPPGWAEGTITFCRVGNTSQMQAIAYDGHHNVVGGRTTRTMSRAFNDLRRVFTQPGKGAFLTARYTLKASDGSITVDYDYDSEPAFDAPIDPGHYVEELQQNPRSPEHIPAWWQERIIEARRAHDL